MQPDLLAALIDTWPDTLSGHCHLALALSGGLDSMVLLDLLCRWRDEAGGPALFAIHVHHGISPHADAWLQHCQAECAARAVPLHATRVQLHVAGQGLEAAARQARYDVFAASSATVLALAHHADDQSETVLLQLLRGGGVRALAAMPQWRAWQGRQLWRPLLGVPRAQLAVYAGQRGLRWVEDESNADTVHYLRNHLRWQVLPGLRQRQPGLDARLARSAAQMADAAAIVEEVAAQDLRAAQAGSHALTLSVWLALTAARQRQLLLHWLASLAWPAPSPAALLALQRDWQAGRDARLDGGAGVLLRYRGQLLAVPWGLPADWPQPCVPGQPQRLAAGELSWRWQAGGLSELAAQRWQLRGRRDGDALLTRVGRKPLKKLFQEAGVPALLRSSWPVLCDEHGQLLALPGIAVAANQAAEAGWWPCWQPLSAPRPDGR